MRMKKLMVVMAMVLVVCGAFAVAAQAAPVLDFEVILSVNQATDNGVIEYNPAGGTLSGHDIQVDSVIGLDTPLNPNVALAISNGLAFFGTGNFTGPSPNELNFATDIGVLNIFGGIPAIGIPDNTQLVNASAITEAHVLIGPAGGTALLNFTDEKNVDLLAFYGLTNDQLIGGTLNIQFQSLAIDPTGATPFTSINVLSGDITNTVPVPPAVWLLGSGLLGLAGLRFRRNRA
jgi:hypothetical protein